MASRAEDAFRILGLFISRRTDLLALAAFILSILIVGYQLTLFFSGPQVQMRLGDRVSLIGLGGRDSPLAFVVSARLTYLNTGPQGKDAILEQEWVAICIGDEVQLCFNWLNYESYHDREYVRFSDATDARRALPERVYQDSAHAVVVPGGGAVSHQTTFVGLPEFKGKCDANFDTVFNWDDFIDVIRFSEEIRFAFEAKLEGDNDVEASCTVHLSDQLRSHLREVGWQTVLCDRRDR